MFYEKIIITYLKEVGYYITLGVIIHLHEINNNQGQQKYTIFVVFPQHYIIKTWD